MESSTRNSWLAGCCMAAMVLGVSGGCQQSVATAPSPSPPRAVETAPQAKSEVKTAAQEKVSQPIDAAELLQQVVANYRDAKSYEDAGELFLRIETPQGQKQETPPIPFSVTFERPSRIRIHSLDASVVADGEKLRATIEALPDQVMVVAYQGPLQADLLDKDAMLRESMRGQLGVNLPQVVLLLDANPIERLAGSGSPIALDDAELNGQRCHRVMIKGPEGESVFWISPETKLLVRYDFPSDMFRMKNELAKAEIWAEFRGARINKAIGRDVFKMEVPPNARRLTRFFLPPPRPPSEMLGKPVGDFTFLSYSGGPVTQESLKGKVAVLDMWATWCGWCFRGFPNLQTVYDQFADNEKVQILAVNTDDPSVSDELVKKSFTDNKLTIPIVRDQQRFNSSVFKVEGLPTMVVLGPSGNVEAFHVGYDSNLAETLPKKIERILAGENLAADELARYEKERAQYDAELAAAIVKE